jgi:hypothetical protein
MQYPAKCSNCLQEEASPVEQRRPVAADDKRCPLQHVAHPRRLQTAM